MRTSQPFRTAHRAGIVVKRFEEAQADRVLASPATSRETLNVEQFHDESSIQIRAEAQQ
jgi:hypothetical protein